jgi:membrane protease YdiL (CAAX protease family)
MPGTGFSLPWIGFYAFCLWAALLWFHPMRRLWRLLAIALVGLLMAAGLVTPIGAALLGLTAVALNTAATWRRFLRQVEVFHVIGVLLVMGLSAHLLPGFSPYQLIGPVQLSPDATSYSRWFSADKAFAGILFLANAGPVLYYDGWWKPLLFRTLPIAVVTTGVVFGLAFAAGFVAFAPKWTPLIGTFALSNLFLTCIPEEVVFRRIIQGAVATWLTRVRYGWAAAILVGAVLFGLAHLGGGVAYAALATVAGLGYGYAYHATGRVEAAILTHFALNLAHFSLLTYPALA